ncbi:hypothetical protein ACPXCP_17625 [Streptomyces sp. DT20]|uniref:hypothetical protein n=1 Tax=Streptomyces sp. DT20 TaxID=3416519 RepID=UPI003CF4F052
MAEYVADETWKSLVRGHRARGCDDLAELARNILNGKEQMRAVAGRAADRLLEFLGRSHIERTFAQELVRRIPLPWDAKLVAAARGLQIAGIYLCFAGNRGLSGCACLRDVLSSDGKAQVQNLIQGAAEDWSRLPHRMANAAE